MAYLVTNKKAPREQTVRKGAREGILNGEESKRVPSRGRLNETKKEKDKKDYNGRKNNYLFHFLPPPFLEFFRTVLFVSGSDLKARNRQQTTTGRRSKLSRSLIFSGSYGFFKSHHLLDSISDINDSKSVSRRPKPLQ